MRRPGRWPGALPQAAARPLEGHGSRNDGSTACPQDGVPLPAARPDVAWVPRSGIPTASQGNLHSWLFLAPTSGMPERPATKLKDCLLETEAGLQPKARPGE